MALLNKITRGNLHECILANSTTHTIQEKKIALNYVLNVLKTNKDDDEVQNVIEEITKCLATSFFNRYLCIYLFIYIYIFILFYISANDR